MGDVPAALSSLGTPEEMEEYCKKLIDEIGKGGGFILSTACVCPVDAKYENIKRMIQTAKTYPYPK
jgi:uroporphyrinogen-III decarboxylase